MGRQPEFVECIDFQPLIDPVMDMNYTDFNPVRPLNGRGRRSNGQSLVDDMETAPQAKRKTPQDHLIMRQFLEPTTEERTADSEIGSTQMDSLEQLDNTAEQTNSNEILTKNNNTLGTQKQSSISNEVPNPNSPYSSSTSSETESDLFIYIPKFRQKDPKNQLVVRTLNCQFRSQINQLVSEIDTKRQTFCTYCGSQKPTQIVKQCQEARRRLVSYELTTSDEEPNVNTVQKIRKTPGKLIKKRKQAKVRVLVMSCPNLAICMPELTSFVALCCFQKSFERVFSKFS